jgi:hypothetical protein
MVKEKSVWRNTIHSTRRENTHLDIKTFEPQGDSKTFSGVLIVKYLVDPISFLKWSLGLRQPPFCELVMSNNRTSMDPKKDCRLSVTNPRKMSSSL